MFGMEKLFSVEDFDENWRNKEILIFPFFNDLSSEIEYFEEVRGFNDLLMKC